MNMLSDLWIGVIAGTMTVLALSLVMRVVLAPMHAGVSCLSANARRIIIPALLVLPAVVGTTLAIIMAVSDHHLPFDLMAHHCHSDAVGCAAHGRVSDYLPLTAIGAGLLTIFLSWTLFGMAEKLHAIVETNQRLQRTVSTRQDTAFILDIATPLAFCAGLFMPKVYVSKGLTERLSADELEMVRLHEASHITGRDLLVRFIVSLLSFGQFGRVRSALMAALVRAQEEVCDQQVARQYGRVETAEMLVKVQRLRQSCSGLSPQILAAVDHGDISARTLALLSPEQTRSRTTKTFIAVAALGLAFALLLASEPLHHFIETLFLSLKG